jgi:DNA-binding response OmpR family regulator
MLKIFLVEDDSTMLSLLCTLLQMEGFQAIPAKEDLLENVFEAIRQERPSLVLVDVNLTRFNGFDLLKKIRGDIDLQNTRVILSSGMDYSTRCRQEGADDFLLKPYMPDDLIQKIRQVIRTERN